MDSVFWFRGGVTQTFRIFMSDKNPTQISMRDLLEAGAHFGHQTRFGIQK